MTLRTEDFETLDDQTLISLIGTNVLVEAFDSDDKIRTTVVGTVTAIRVDSNRVTIRMADESGSIWDTEEFYAKLTWLDNGSGKS